MRLSKRGNLQFYHFKGLSGFNNEVLHFISTRGGGVSDAPYDSLNLGFHVGDKDGAVQENRGILARELGISQECLTLNEQVHDNRIGIVESSMRGRGAFCLDDALDGCDAMITNVPNVCIMVLVADCVPLLLFDHVEMVVAVAHAGWKGTMGCIGERVVRELCKHFNSSPENLMAGIGPSIGPCCYEIGQGLVEDFEKRFGKEVCNIEPVKNGKVFLDLWAINKWQLRMMGVSEGNIEVARVCNCCHADTFFSYRHQNGMTGRFAAGIMIRSG